MEINNLAEDGQDFTGNIWHLEASDESVLVDVGTGDSWESVRGLEGVDKVVVTHSHYDHVDNLEKVVEMFEPEVHAYEPGNLKVEASTLSEGDTVELCSQSFEVFHTPGHKNDSICLHSNSKILFTGDLIFPDGGFGRTDLDEGDREKLIESINKINELDVEAFYPGHGEAVVCDADKSVKASLQAAKQRNPKY